MVNGVFGAAGYRASLGEGNLSGEDDHHSEPQRADRMIDEPGIVYGAEPIPREMAGGHAPHQANSRREKNRRGESSHPMSSTRRDDFYVGRVRGSDLYVTRDFAFQLGLASGRKNKSATNESPKIKHLLRMFHFTHAEDRAEEFVREAKYMSDYEPQGSFDSSLTFHAYYPVYADMTLRQLNGYFAWRTRIRHGQYFETSTSSAFVYVYELLNCVGVKNAADAYQRLLEFCDKYAARCDPIVGSYLSRWMRDFVIAHNLTGKPLKKQFSPERSADRFYVWLTHPDDWPDVKIARAQRRLGSYVGRRSPLNGPVGMPPCKWMKIRFQRPLEKNETSLYDTALAAVWKAIFKSHVTVKGYFHSRVAKWTVTPITLFKCAIWYDQDLADHPSQARQVMIDPVRQYARENGHWYLGYYEPVLGQRSNMNDLLHEVDRVGRLVWQTGRPLQPRGFYPPYEQIVVQALKKLKTKLDQARWKAEHPPVHVDLSKLSAIRTAAAGTQESLLTKEEREAEAEEVQREDEELKERKPEKQTVTGSSVAAGDAPAKKAPQVESSPQEASSPLLSGDEVHLLKELVAGMPPATWKKRFLSEHVLPSVLADSINDKLFDLVGDSVVETDENGDPSLVEDYRDDVKDFLASQSGKDDTHD